MFTWTGRTRTVSFLFLNTIRWVVLFSPPVSSFRVRRYDECLSSDARMCHEEELLVLVSPSKRESLGKMDCCVDECVLGCLFLQRTLCLRPTNCYYKLLKMTQTSTETVSAVALTASGRMMNQVWTARAARLFKICHELCLNSEAFSHRAGPEPLAYMKVWSQISLNGL